MINTISIILSVFEDKLMEDVASGVWIVQCLYRWILCKVMKFGFTVIWAAEKFWFLSETVPLLTQSFFLWAFAWSRIISLWLYHVRLSACFSAAPTVQISAKFCYLRPLLKTVEKIENCAHSNIKISHVAWEPKHVLFLLCDINSPENIVVKRSYCWQWLVPQQYTRTILRLNYDYG